MAADANELTTSVSGVGGLWWRSDPAGRWCGGDDFLYFFSDDLADEEESGMG